MTLLMMTLIVHRHALLAALLLAPMMTIPTSLAAPTPTCASVTEQSATPYGPYLVEIRSQVYELWAEQNLLPGLQRVECLDAQSQLVQPDRRVTTIGIEGGGQPVCVPRLGCIWI